jgi:hypothetical protein
MKKKERKVGRKTNSAQNKFEGESLNVGGAGIVCVYVGNEEWGR